MRQGLGVVRSVVRTGRRHDHGDRGRKPYARRTHGDDVAWFKDASYKVANSIIGGTVYNADGMAVAGAAFDPASMLSPLGDNGGATKTCVLLGDANPARQYGMSASELKILGETLDPAFGEAVSAIDQTGASRTGKTVIGAVVK